MPTTKQLMDSWRAQFKMGLSGSDYYCNDHSPEPSNETNYKPKGDFLEELSGEKLGTVEYNSKTKTLSVKIDGPQKD
jgi:hypothetical protein